MKRFGQSKQSKYTKKRDKKPVQSESMNKTKYLPSDFLVARPSFASGVARLMDFGGTFDEYNRSSTEAQADAMATLSDWLNVGYDLLSAKVKDTF